MPWGHNLVLLSKLKDPEQRLDYARASIANGWSRNVLSLQIQGRQLERAGKAVTNFEARLPAPDSGLARQALKDPYLFDFLSIGDEATEREVEAALVEHMTQFLL